VGWDKLTGVPSGLGDGDDDTTYTAGTGLNLVGSQFSAVQSTIEGWATGVCYHTPTELAEALPGWDQDVADDLTPDDLALVASSGSYEDLTDQPDLSPFATKSDTYTKDEVDQAIAQAVAAAIQGLDDCPSDMVQVGDFCIDRYETSLWTRNSGEPVDCGVLQAAVDEAKASGWTAQELYEGLKVADCGVGALAMCDYRQHGSEPGCTNNAGCDDYPDGFPNNGNWTVPVYACAIEGVGPSRSLTWFQAQQACVLSGRRLCFDSEWQAAAAGTPDPVAIVPVAGTESCNIWPNSKPGERDWATENQSVKTQSEAACVSNHGAYDMVGNLWEWTADWWGQGGDADDGNQPNDGDFHGDGYWNVDNAQSNGTYDEGNPVFPASARRGGSWDSGSTAGVFALLLNYGPANWHHGSGARCCRRK